MNSIIIGTLFYILGIVGSCFDLMPILLTITTIIVVFCILRKITSTKLCIIFYLIFILGFINTSIQNKENDFLGKLKSQNDVALQGRIISVPQLSLNKTRMKFYLETENVNNTKIKTSKTLVTINEENKNFKDVRIGDFIALQGNLRNPTEASNPSQFNYSHYLKNKNTFSVFYVKDNNYNILHSPVFNIKNKPSENWWATLRKLDITRDNIIEKHAKHIPEGKLEIISGIVFGNEAINPPDDVKQIFINSGLLHLLAASGLNVGIIFFIWYFIASLIGLGYRTKIITSALLILLYTFMTGFPPSILRASIMMMFVLFGKLIYRQTNTLTLIFLVGFLILLFNPLMLTDVGFELSFLVTIGLVICSEPIINLFKTKEIEFKNKHQKAHPCLKRLLHFISPAYIAGIIATPLIAQLWVAPLQMYYFNNFVPYSILANIIVVPFVAVISFLGFIGSMLGLIPFVSDFIVKITDFITLPFISGLLNISTYFSELPHSVISTPSPNILQMVLYYLFLILFFNALNLKFKNKKFNIAICITILIFTLTFIKIPNKDFEIMAFDVGNADSFLIKTPNNSYILIDAGKLPYRGISSAKLIINEYFKDNSIKNIDLMILTHFDDDHIGGAIDIFENIKVNKVLIRESYYDTKNSYETLNYMNFKKMSYEIPKSNEIVYNKDDVKITTFYTDFKDRKFENENSIICLVEYKDKKILFMADAGIYAFENL